MIPLISVKDRIELVFSTDNDVLKNGSTEDPAQCRAIPLDKAKIRKGGSPLVATVRPLTSREAMRVFTDERQSETIFQACDLGTCAIRGEGINAIKPDEVSSTLELLPIAVISALGAYIIQASTEGPENLAKS